MIYLQLFWAFIQIGMLSFGGGYASMSLIQNQVIFKYQWLTPNDFLNLVAIAEMTPGPIAVNAATFVGNQVAGIPGSIVATLGVILPSCIIVTILAWVYTRYKSLKIVTGVLNSVRPAIISIISVAGISILFSTIFKDGTPSLSSENLSYRMILYCIISYIIIRKKKMSPIKCMISFGIIELIFTIITNP